MWESYGSLADAETRTAFLHTLRSVIDVSANGVSTTNRFYLAADVPTLIVWGDHDPIIPVEQAHTTRTTTIPDSRLEIFEGAGHFPHCDDRERFCRVLTEFMSSTEPAAVSTPQWQELLVRNTPLQAAP